MSKSQEKSKWGWEEKHFSHILCSLIESTPKTLTRPKVLLLRLCSYIVPLFYALNVVSGEEDENIIFSVSDESRCI